MKNIVIIVMICCSIAFSSCKKLVNVDGPKTSVSSKDVFNNDQTAAGALSALYVNLGSSSNLLNTYLIGLSCVAGLSADELTYFSGASPSILTPYYRNDLINTNGYSDIWHEVYSNMFTVNSAIEGIVQSYNLTPVVKDQLLGEAKFMRAFYYFYLVNLYGEVPLVLSTEYNVNALISKSSKDEVYRQIIKDLKDAKSLLSDKYLKGDAKTIYSNGLEERVRPTKWAAMALLARTYLYNKEWANAEGQSTEILANKSQYDLIPLNDVFLKNSKESIWQLPPTGNGFNTIEANTFVLPPEGPSDMYPVYLSKELILVFENQDLRKSIWTGNVTIGSIKYYYPLKYKVIRSSNADAPVTEYSTVLRLAEQYLIRAEARARQGNLDGAIEDLDLIRNRAGLNLIKTSSPYITQENLTKTVLNEKRLELFTEWGHRWLDLKRTGEIDEVMKNITPIKGNTSGWKSYQQYYPIYLNELQSNPNLVQTTGY